MKQMAAKYSGTCKHCGGGIAKGEQIEWSKGQGASHADCARMRATKRTPMTGARVHTVQFNGGDSTVYTRNANGRCEDAPCCGCCTI